MFRITFWVLENDLRLEMLFICLKSTIFCKNGSKTFVLGISTAGNKNDGKHSSTIKTDAPIFFSFFPRLVSKWRLVLSWILDNSGTVHL
jgi:hypothetical protein